MKTLNEMLENQMQDEKFRKEYEEMQPEFDVIRAIVDARTSQNLTQKELSERTGIIRQISANWKMEQGIHLLAY